MEENQNNNDSVILVMRPSQDRTRIISELIRQAAVRVFCFQTKDDVLEFLTNQERAQTVKMFVGDFSDIQINAWDILEPLRIVIQVPMFFIIPPNDTFYRQMIGKGIAGTFTQPISVDAITTTLAAELANPTQFNQKKFAPVDTTGIEPPAIHLVKKVGTKYPLEDEYFGKLAEKEYGDHYLHVLDAELFGSLRLIGLKPRYLNKQNYKSVDLTARMIADVQQLEEKYELLFKELRTESEQKGRSAKQ